MNDSKMDDKELLSALADGQLDDRDMARGLQALASDPQARERWHTYHLIGDVLRAPELAEGTPTAAFVERLSLRLAAEPAPGAVQGLQALQADVEPPVVQHTAAAPVARVPQAGRPVANDSRFRWRFRLAAGFASLAVLGLGAWMALGASQDANQARLALEAMPPRVGMVVTPTAKGPMLRDPVLDEMLATHRQLGDVTALQAPAAGLHNATFEPADR